MELHKNCEPVILGEDLLKSLNNHDRVKIKIRLITNNNIYGTCCKHLIPISTHPLVTPYSISLSHNDFNNLRKLLKNNNSTLMMKMDEDAIKIWNDNYLISEIPKEIIKVYRRYHASHRHITNNHVGSNYDGIKVIMNIIAIFLTLIRNIDILAIKQPLHTIIKCREEKQEMINCLTNLISNSSGIGSGSTPSSDDFIIGFLVGIHDLINNNNKTRLLLLLKHLRTTWLSKLLIKEVLRDPAYIINLHRLYMVLFNSTYLQTDEIISSIIDFIRIGSSSGLFMLSGLITGFSYRNALLLNLWKSVLYHTLSI
jgi:hypothetical protein